MSNYHKSNVDLNNKKSNKVEAKNIEVQLCFKIIAIAIVPRGWCHLQSFSLLQAI